MLRPPRPRPGPSRDARAGGWTASASSGTLGRMRPVYLALAGLCFVLAVLGVFLPVLPTTPFLLLTSACLVRSSPRLNERLRKSPLFGPFLRDWEKHHGVRLHVKVTALTLIALVVAWSLFYRDLEVVPRVVLCALALIGAFVVLRLKTVRGD
jgi:uncharacterized protein